MSCYFIASSATHLTSHQKTISDYLLCTAGDPFTRIVPSSQSAAFKDDVFGEVAQAGLAVGKEEGKQGVQIVSVLRGSEAERAGIFAGDTLVSINGRLASTMPVECVSPSFHHSQSWNVMQLSRLQYKPLDICDC